MTSPAPKRRKTLPDSGPASAPATPSRASYRSPTKASLSRWNPSLLPAPRSPSPRTERDLSKKRGSNALEYVLGKTDDLGQDEEPSKEDHGGELVVKEDDAQHGADETGDELHAPERARRAQQDTGDDTRMEVEEEEADLPETPHGGILPAEISGLAA